MNSLIKTSCSSLLKQCDNNIAYKLPVVVKESYALNQLKKKLQNCSLNLISPQEDEHNHKIIDKMRKRYIKKNQQKSIKKTDLGQDLLTFTKEQYDRLQMIDACLDKGFIFTQKSQQTNNDPDCKLTAVERLKKLAKLDDIREEIKTNYSWGEMSDKPKRMFLKIKNHPRFVTRLDQEQSCKIFLPLAGQKLQRETMTKKYSLNNYFTKLLNKNTNARYFLNTNVNWATVNAGDSLSFSQKLQIIKDQANKYLSKLCSSKNIYMTQQRKNAIYECQILRLSKKILTEKQYQNLHFTLNEKQSVMENIEKENKNQSNKVEDEDKNCQAEQILEKNYKRIKLERKRVIERLY